MPNINLIIFLYLDRGIMVFGFVILSVLKLFFLNVYYIINEKREQ